MTTAYGWNIPQWTIADRMDKAMRNAGLTVGEMATYFDVHRNTVSGWINGRIKPDTRTLRLWAVRTGAPYEWLRYGMEPVPDNPPGYGGQVSDKKRKPPQQQTPHSHLAYDRREQAAS